MLRAVLREVVTIHLHFFVLIDYNWYVILGLQAVSILLVFFFAVSIFSRILTYRDLYLHKCSGAWITKNKKISFIKNKNDKLLWCFTCFEWLGRYPEHLQWQHFHWREGHDSPDNPVCRVDYLHEYLAYFRRDLSDLHCDKRSSKVYWVMRHLPVLPLVDLSEEIVWTFYYFWRKGHGDHLHLDLWRRRCSYWLTLGRRDTYCRYCCCHFFRCNLSGNDYEARREPAPSWLHRPVVAHRILEGRDSDLKAGAVVLVAAEVDEQHVSPWVHPHKISLLQK